jgi:hypothetical protein
MNFQNSPELNTWFAQKPDFLAVITAVKSGFLTSSAGISSEILLLRFPYQWQVVDAAKC